MMWLQWKIFTRYFKDATVREFILLMLKAVGFYRGRDLQVTHHFVLFRLLKDSLRISTAVSVRYYKVGQESVSQELADSSVSQKYYNTSV